MAHLLRQTRALLTIPALSEPSRGTIVLTEEPGEEFVQLSRKLGINKIPLRLAELAQVVREETLGVYPYEDVARYLDKQVERLMSGKSDSWRFRYEWRWHPVKEYSSHRSWSDSPFDSRVYNKPIPPEIMVTIERMLDRMADAEFYVTDVQNYKDPFLGVTVPGSDTLFVIERWNEPAFRQKAYGS
jgi:hypothetical protein